jgi:hypothetical protein
MFQRVELLGHPDNPASPTRRFQVEIGVLPDGALRLRYVLETDLDRLRLPSADVRDRTDGLWRHTCCELFLTGVGMPGYREFNFSPSGQWQAYVFRGYREGGLLNPVIAPDINLEWGSGQLALDVSLPVANLPATPRLRLGACAVTETTDGSLSYWALRHPPGKPDFHHPDTFALEIDLREGTR